MTIRHAIIAEPPSRSEVATEEALLTLRKNYLLPPRSHRAFPLAELL